MDNQLAIDLIINKQKYPLIYNATIILSSILIIITLILFTFKYQSYYVTKGAMKNNELELLVNIDEKITKEIYMDNNYNNYRYIYLKIDNLKNIDYYTYQVKLPKENKTLAWYLKKYL